MKKVKLIKTHLTLCLRDKHWAAFELAAKEEGKSRSEIIRMWIDQYLETYRAKKMRQKIDERRNTEGAT